MFEEKRDGLTYIGSDHKEYELVEGISSNGYTSDILFMLDRNNIEKTIVIDFIYGGFREENKKWIKETIEKYIENKKGVQ